MKKVSFVTLLGVIAFIVGITGSLFGQPPGPATEPFPPLQDRYALQHERIHEGIRLKELSPDEAKQLLDDLNSIKNQEARWRAAEGGEITHPQLKELHKLLDRNSVMIYEMRHKRQ